MHSIQAVIFDMDGVIIDSHPAHRRAWKDFLGTLGKQVTDGQLDFILDGRKRREILRHFLGDLTEAELAEYGRQKDEFFQQIALDVKPLPGVLGFIEELQRRQIGMAVATSASKSRTASTLAQLNLTRQFAEVVTGDDVPDGKPDPAIYHLVCSRLKTEPQQALVFEDAVPAVRAAKGAGFRCVGVGCNGSREALVSAGADYVIKDFVGFSLDDLYALRVVPQANPALIQ